MNEKQFRQTLDELRATNSRNEKKELIQEVQDSPAAISFLSGSEFDDAGLGKKTVLGVAQEAFPDYGLEGKPTVSEDLAEFETDVHVDGFALSHLHEQMRELAEESGNEQKEHLKRMFHYFEYPSLVAHACLNDWPTGVGNSTIAKAMGVKDSLPFYEGVHEIAQAPDAITAPMVGRPFKPMLAVPESRGQPDNPMAQRKVDGYRVIIHLKEEEIEQKAYAYSRRMNDVTESLPELQEIDWPDGEYILDGEVIAETGSYSDTSERIGRKAENVEREVEMNFALFDVLVADGMHIWQEPLHERHSRLVTFASIECEDERVYHLGLTGDIEAAKDDAASNDEEGIIVKDFQAPYEFDKRSSSWQKVKMDDETVDLNIAGFDEGTGRLDGTLGRVRLETSDGVFVGYSGSGFNDAQRDDIWHNKDEWMGRTIEIEARGLGTEDKLRMPIFVRDRSADGEPDSWERVQEVMADV